MTTPVSGSSWSIQEMKFMKLALRIAEKAKGLTEPNPMVGAVVVKGDRILATGYHPLYGHNHAERLALERVTEKNATLYVTLEPCAHFGKTPPCVDIIIQKKIGRVVAAMRDPNPLVNGRGIKKLRRNGIEVQVGLMAEESGFLNRHYLKYIRSNVPHVTLRAGISLDGKLTDRKHRSRWVTSPTLRRLSHSLRGECSAILVGRNTAVRDDPGLLVSKNEWPGKTHFRVVLDSQNSLPDSLRIFRNQGRSPLILFSSKDSENRRRRCPNHFFVSHRGQRLDLKQVLNVLTRLGIASVLVEGGGQVIDSFLLQGFYDEVILFVAPIFVGGREAVELFPSGVENIKRALRLKHVEIIALHTGWIVRGFKNV